MTASPPDARIDTRLDALLADARTVERDLAEGREPDTAALETAVQELCAEIGALPLETGRTYLPRLQDLTDAMDRISAVIRDRLAGIGAELKQHGARQSAVRAYGKAGTAGGAPDSYS
jgi:hypothetical protein